VAQSLTARPVDPQLAQYLASYCRVKGHEPSAQEIAEFEQRNRLASASLQIRDVGMGAGDIVAVYLIGLVLVWALTACAMRTEPTTHGQDVLYGMGCIGGILWPLVIAYLIIASPWIAWTLWHERKERR
jgi:hypothetical protein